MFATRSKPGGQIEASLSFPKAARILRSSEFRNVYERGTRVAGPLFAAFCLERLDGSGARVGFRVSKAVGNAVQRNRIRRRLREAVRLRLRRIPPQWDLVFSARRAALDAPFAALEKELERLLARCGS